MHHRDEESAELNLPFSPLRLRGEIWVITGEDALGFDPKPLDMATGYGI
jgi:hypothetical protein